METLPSRQEVLGDWAMGSSERQRLDFTLKLKPIGFADGLDIERGRNQVLSRAWDQRCWRNGVGAGRQVWVGEQSWV